MSFTESASSSIKADKSLCFFCFGTVINSLSPSPTVSLPPLEPISSALFVTWKETADDTLAGCIGTFAPMPIESGLKEYALISALRDDRFDPVTLESIKLLSCTVSLLKPAVRCGLKDWEIGKHGINIKFKASNRSYSATFLPEVAEEQGWDQDQTVLQAVRKSGFRGDIDDNLLQSIHLETYESVTATASYEEFLASQT